MSRVTSRQKLPAEIPDDKAYCRKCMKIRPVTSFYEATDRLLDSNGRCSVCTDCVNELYNTFLEVDHSPEMAILRLCRILNVVYAPDAVESARKQIETWNQTGKPNAAMFGVYKSKMAVLLRTTKKDKEIDLTYKDVTNIVVTKEELTTDHVANPEELKRFWGTDDKIDIEFLENELAGFKASHKCDTYSELTLLKEVCHRLLEINKTRREGGSVDSKLKGLQELMKNLAISPNMASAANSGENLDTYGKIIEAMEKEEPAQWLEGEGHELYKDVDNVESYFQQYFVRPLRNFILQSKDFTIDGVNPLDDPDDSPDIEDEVSDAGESLSA